jgi:hypothetical protein
VGGTAGGGSELSRSSPRGSSAPLPEAAVAGAGASITRAGAAGGATTTSVTGGSTGAGVVAGEQAGQAIEQRTEAARAHETTPICMRYHASLLRLSTMAEPSPSTMPITAAHLLCVYAEPLAAGRRVLVIGDASADLGGRLVELGARAVHVYDPVAQRVEHAPRPRGVTVQALREAEFEVRDGAFDLAIVPDVGTLRDPAGVLARLRRIVGPDGAVLVSSKNPEAASFDDIEPTTQARRPLDYYELYDLVSMQFTTVRMIGQVAFNGYAIAELGESDGDPEVTVDTQLVTESEPPEYFLALASQKDARLEPYAIVQVPREAREPSEASEPMQVPVPVPVPVLVAVVVPESVVALPVPPPSTTAAVAEAKAPLQAALMEAQLRANALAAQLDQERALRKRLSGEADLAGAQRVEELEDALRASAHRIDELEDGLVERMDACRQLADEIDEQRALIATLEDALRAAEDSVPLLEERVLELQRVAVDRTEQCAILLAELEAAAANVPRIDAAKVTQLVAHASRLEARILELESELHHAGDGHGTEVGQAEALLRERAQRIQGLDRELHRRERMIQDLLAALEEERGGKAPDADELAATAQAFEANADAHEALLAASRENASMRSKLDAMALDVARREGELQTLTWKITEQAEQLQQRSPDGTSGRLEEELDFVKKALTQEHEARVRTESELARQAALVEKLSGELDAGDRVRSARP